MLGLRFVWGLSLVAASGGHSSLRCAGLSLLRPLLLRSTGSRRTGSVVVAHGPSCSAACGIFPDQGSNPCPLHWHADSQPLRDQGSPVYDPFNVLLDSFCKYFVEDFCIYGHQWYWSVIFLSLWYLCLVFVSGLWWPHRSNLGMFLPLQSFGRVWEV